MPNPDQNMHILSQIVDVEEGILQQYRSNSLLSIGVDSQRFVYLQSCLREKVSIWDLYNYPIERIMEMDFCLPTANGEDLTSLFEPFPLTDMQKSFWIGRFDGEELTPCQVYNEFDFEELDLNNFCAAVRATVANNAMLRARITPKLDQMIMSVEDSLENVFPMPTHLQNEIERRKYCESYHMSHPDCFWSIHYNSLPNGHMRLYVLVDLLFLDVKSILMMVQAVAKSYNDLHTRGVKTLPSAVVKQAPDFSNYIKSKSTSIASYAGVEEKEEKVKIVSLAPTLPQHGLKHLITNFSERYQREEITISHQCWSALKEICHQTLVTPTTLLLTLLFEVLELFSEQRFFTLSVTSVDQDYRYAQTVGNFTSVLLANNYYSSFNMTTPSFWEKVRSIQQEITGQRESGNNGFAMLSKLKQLSGDQRLFFPIVFTSLLSIEFPNRLRFGNIFPTLHYQQTRTPKVWFDLQAYELPIQDANGVGKTLHFHCDYDQSIYSKSLIQEILSNYETLIYQLHQSCESNVVSKNDLLTIQMKARLPPTLEERRIQCNQTHQSFPYADLTFHEIVYNTLIASPENLSLPALVDQTISLSRRDFLQAVNRLSQQIIHQLLRANHHPLSVANTRICLVLEKGWEQIVSIFAILVAGGTYVPINPSHPTARITEIVAQVDSCLLITQARNSYRWKDIPCEQLIVDHTLLSFPSDDSCDKTTSASENDLLTWDIKNRDIKSIAYIIFTSGTEGRPKGVAVSHEGAVNTCLDLISRFQITANDRVFALSSYTFDLSVFDCFALLMVGGSIIMCKPDGTRDPDYWVDQITTHRITIWNTVPTSFFMLIESNWDILLAEQQRKESRKNNDEKIEAILASLRIVMLSGDAIKLSKLLQYKQQFFSDRSKEMIFACLGGATEASIWSNYHIIPVKEEDYPEYYPMIESAPYGRALANQTLYVFDEFFEYRLDLVVGKIYIGGIGLAEGYYNDTVLTNQSFIVHEKYGRIYNTGDFGRYLPNGEIDILGRRDQQVKIRGFRIELSEIERCVERLDWIQQAVVICRKANTNYLVGFVVLEENQNVNDCKTEKIEKLIKDHCALYLPDYMEVAKWMIVSTIPLSLNGKIDRKGLDQQLQLLSRKQTSSSRNQENLRIEGEEVEELQAEILSCVKQLLLIVDDDQQDLLHSTSKLMEFGMDSLMGVRLARELSKLYQIKLPSTLIFQYETVREISLFIKQLQEETQRTIE